MVSEKEPRRDLTRCATGKFPCCACEEAGIEVVEVRFQARADPRDRRLTLVVSAGAHKSGTPLGQRCNRGIHK